MNKSRFGLMALLALLVFLPVTSSAQGRDTSPCSDSLYVALKQRPVDSLSAREYELFRERDRACIQRGTIDNAANRVAPPTNADASSVSLAITEGHELAGAEGTSGWFIGGVGSGLVLGLIGTAIITVTAHNSSSDIPASRQSLLAMKPPEYSQAFARAYRERVKSRKRNSALGGGLVGTAAFLVIYLNGQSGN